MIMNRKQFQVSLVDKITSSASDIFLDDQNLMNIFDDEELETFVNSIPEAKPEEDANADFKKATKGVKESFYDDENDNYDYDLDDEDVEESFANCEYDFGDGDDY